MVSLILIHFPFSFHFLADLPINVPVGEAVALVDQPRLVAEKPIKGFIEQAASSAEEPIEPEHRVIVKQIVEGLVQKILEKTGKCQAFIVMKLLLFTCISFHFDLTFEFHIFFSYVHVPEQRKQLRATRRPAFQCKKCKYVFLGAYDITHHFKLMHM